MDLTIRNRKAAILTFLYLKLCHVLYDTADINHFAFCLLSVMKNVHAHVHAKPVFVHVHSCSEHVCQAVRICSCLTQGMQTYPGHADANTGSPGGVLWLLLKLLPALQLLLMGVQPLLAAVAAWDASTSMCVAVMHLTPPLLLMLVDACWE